MNLTGQVLLDEKVDIYALGNILFHILTTHAPHGKMKAERMEGIRQVVEQGIKPELPAPFANDTNPIYGAFRRAMDRCFVKDPSKRATAQEIVDIFMDALVKEFESVDKQKPHASAPA